MCGSKFYHNFMLVYVFLVYFAGNWDYANSVEIECTPLKSCPTVLKLIATAGGAPETAEFLEISRCGFDEENRPKVWCSKLNGCVTPQNKNGTCIPARQCKPFMQLRDTLNTADTKVEEFLNKFRCNEILEEQHVCCQNEPFESQDDDEHFRTMRQPNSLHKLTLNERSIDSEYDSSSDESSDHFDYHGYHDDFHPHHRGGSTDSRHNQIPRRQFKPNYNGYNHRAHHRQKEPETGFDFPYHREINGMSNRNNKPYINFERTGDTHHRTTERVDYEQTTIRNMRTTRDDIATTVRRRQNFNPNKPTPSLTSRRTTPSYDSTTNKINILSIGEDDIIFEDSFEDLLKGIPRTTTEKTTKPSSQNNKSCETPDEKSGICTRPTDCQPYITLQNNLDRSKESVRNYLTKFKCGASDEICCQKDEENVIDNSLFNVERTNENVPEPVSRICGRPTLSTDRIVGGSLTDLGEFPWLALLQYPSDRGIQSSCGGSLINSRYVVTAAHCVDEKILSNRGLRQVRQVVLGEYDTRNETDCIYMALGQDCAEPAKIYRVESVIAHSMYSSSTTQNDIALLRLDQKVIFTDYIKPICLPTKTSSLRGNEIFIIAGWGRTATETFSPVLRKAKIPSANKASCNRRNRPLTDGQICAGNGNGTDSCNGDSGGPLMLQINLNSDLVTQLMGVISYGFLDCGMGSSVNTYVPFFIDWINENMKL